MVKFEPKKILIVDDNTHEMLTLSQILLTNGYQLCYAQNETLALTLARKTKPDLIICNTIGTKLDIMKLFDPVNAGTVTRRIPFLFIAESKEELQKCVGSRHSNSLIVKPFTREQLAITVQEKLKKR